MMKFMLCYIMFFLPLKGDSKLLKENAKKGDKLQVVSMLCVQKCLTVMHFEGHVLFCKLTAFLFLFPKALLCHR